MKTILLTITFVFGLSCSAWAIGCTTTTLDNYIADGSCTIGDISFSDFSYSPSGSINIPAADVLVTPETIGGEMGFKFAAPWLALPGGLLDSLIDFTATAACDACQIDDWVLQIGGVSLPPNSDAAVNVGETSLQVPGTGLAVGVFGGQSTLSASATFPPVGSLTVNKDILLYGGSANSGGVITQVSSVTNLFSTTTSTVPEPPLLILCAGLLGLVPVLRHKFVR